MRSLAAGAVGALLALPATAQAPFSDVVFFGDSLTDTGNTCALLVIAGYAPGRCTNGDTWSDHLAGAFGFDAEASIAGGNNFAVGGDRAADLDDQTLRFTLRELAQADPGALFAVWAGGNDVLELPAAGGGAMANAVQAVIGAIDDLEALGARHFLVPNLPDIGRAYGGFTIRAGSGDVFTPAERDLATSLSLEFNAILEDELDAYAAMNPQVTIHRLDVDALVEEVFADPAAFGVVPAAIDTTSDDTDFGVPCLVDPGCSADVAGTADGFFLFDAIHPTAAMHAVIGERALLAVPEPKGSHGATAALLALVAARRRSGRATGPSR